MYLLYAVFHEIIGLSIKIHKDIRCILTTTQNFVFVREAMKTNNIFSITGIGSLPHAPCIFIRHISAHCVWEGNRDQGWGAVSDLSLISDLSQKFKHDLWRPKSKLKLSQKQHLTPAVLCYNKYLPVDPVGIKGSVYLAVTISQKWLSSYLAHYNTRGLLFSVKYLSMIEAFFLDECKSNRNAVLFLQKTIEKTPKYFVHPSAAPRIFVMNDEIRLILILRDPVKRLISDYEHEKRLIKIKRNRSVFVENILPLEELVLTSTGELNVAYEPVVASMYDLHLERCFRYFAMEQTLILDGEKFKQEPVPILRQCENFLGIRNFINDSMLVFHEEKQLFCRRDTGCISNKGHKNNVYPDKFLQKLHLLFAPHVKRTFDMIGQSFEWKTADFIQGNLCWKILM